MSSDTDTGQLQEPEETDDVDDDRVDPENMPRYTPAYVQVRGEGPVYVADYTILESGWIRVREWRNEVVKLPPHKVQAIRNVRTEVYGDVDNNGFKPRRVADEEQRERAKTIDAAVPGTVTVDD